MNNSTIDDNFKKLIDKLINDTPVDVLLKEVDELDSAYPDGPTISEYINDKYNCEVEIEYNYQNKSSSYNHNENWNLAA